MRIGHVTRREQSERRQNGARAHAGALLPGPGGQGGAERKVVVHMAEEDQAVQGGWGGRPKGGLWKRMRALGRGRVEMSSRRDQPDDEDEDRDRTVNPHNVGSVMSHEGLMGKFPGPDEIMRSAVMDKKGSDNKWQVRVRSRVCMLHTPPCRPKSLTPMWQSRRFILTETMLFWTKDGEDVIKDCIPLVEVEHVGITSNFELDVAGMMNPVSTTGQVANGHQRSKKKLLKSRSLLAAGSQRATDDGGARGAEELVQAWTLELHTREGGFCSGKCYFIRHCSEDELIEWRDTIERCAVTGQKLESAMGLSWQRLIQKRVGSYYRGETAQILVAILIVANFLVNAAQSEMLPEKGTASDQTFNAIDVFFTWVFFFELLWNLAAHWFWPFFSDGWSVFDLFVVSVSMAAYFAGSDGGAIKTLRLMRAFRVMRLFGRLKSLRQIITSLTASLIPMGNAFLIMLLVTSIYAILGVNFFAESSPHFFGNFSRALFTLFQVCTGDGWASDIARPLFASINGGGDGLDGPTSAFFISFIVVVGWVLLQVVVAVLLDSFTAAAEEEKLRSAAEKSKFDGRTPQVHAVDPLLAALAHFDTTEDLVHRIHLLFGVLDTDDSMTLTYEELAAGLKKLRVKPQVQISKDDWDVMTLNGSLLNCEGELGLQEFTQVMRRQLKLYVQRQMANAMEMVSSEDHSQTSTLLFVLKLLVVNVDELSCCQGAGARIAGAGAAAENGTGGCVGEERDRLSMLESRMEHMQRTLDRIVDRLERSSGSQDAGLSTGTSLPKTRAISPNLGAMSFLNPTNDEALMASGPGGIASALGRGFGGLKSAFGRGTGHGWTGDRMALPHFDEWHSLSEEARLGVDGGTETTLEASPNTVGEIVQSSAPRPISIKAAGRSLDGKTRDDGQIRGKGRKSKESKKQGKEITGST